MTLKTQFEHFLMSYFSIFFSIHLNIIIFKKNSRFLMFFWKTYFLNSKIFFKKQWKNNGLRGHVRFFIVCLDSKWELGWSFLEINNGKCWNKWQHAKCCLEVGCAYHITPQPHVWDYTITIKRGKIGVLQKKRKSYVSGICEKM